MKEARIIAVVRGPQDMVALQTLQNAIITAFGGFTRYQAHGAWRNPRTGETVYDQSYVFDIAVQDILPTRVKLEELAKAYGRSTGQEEVYLRYPNGNVTFIEIKREQVAA